MKKKGIGILLTAVLAVSVAAMGMTGCAKKETAQETTALESQTGTQAEAPSKELPTEDTKTDDTKTEEESLEEGGGLVEELSQAVFDGTILSIEEDSITMSREMEGGTEDLVIMITEDTRLLDSNGGYPILIDDLEEGMPVRVYVGPAMTMSLPAITNGEVILAGLAENGSFPVYTQVDSLEETGEDTFLLHTVNGEDYLVDSETSLLPYLTRNLVTVQDLTEGTTVLLWTEEGENGEPRAEEIVIFGEDMM